MKIHILSELLLATVIIWSAVDVVAFPVSESGSMKTFYPRDAPTGTKVACGLSCFFGCIACCAECVAYVLCRLFDANFIQNRQLSWPMNPAAICCGFILHARYGCVGRSEKYF